MTQPERPGVPKRKPCAGCGGGHPIYTDGEDFFRWDPESQLYRTVDYNGFFYPIDTHPGCTEVQLVRFYRENSSDGKGDSALKVATEYDIMWRTLRLLVTRLVGNNLN